MAFTVEKMLKMPAFQGAVIAAGEKGLTAPIKSIALLDAPAQIPGSLRGDIILTTTYFLELTRKQDSQAKYATLCHSRGAVGMCIKQSQDFGQLRQMLAQADQLGFPIVILPEDADLCRLITLVNQEILYREGYHWELSYVENFLQEMIRSTQDRDTFAKRGAMLGLAQDERLVAFLLQPDDERIAPQVRDYCRDQNAKKCFTLTMNGRVLVAQRLTASEVSKERILMEAESLLRKLEEIMAPHTFRMGVGRCYKQLSNFNKSFSEACSALSYSMCSRSAAKITHFDNLGVYRILFDYKNRDELYRLYRDTVGVIEDYDRQKNTEYIATIRTFFDENYSVNNTAKKLHVHYNTILYRLKKIKALFHIDLNNENERINLYVSLIAADTQNLWRSY